MSTIAIPELYRSLHSYLMQRIPDDCESRLTNMILMMMGIFQSRSVHLDHMARKTPVRAQKQSIVKRFSRFLKNTAVGVRSWYHPYAQALLEAAAATGGVHLIIDTTKVAGNFRLIMASLAYQRRSLPIAWTWVRGSRGHSTTQTQIKLLKYVTTLLPAQAKVSLVGDCEFGNPLLIEYVQFWKWDYALRQPGDHLMMMKGTGIWQRIDAFPLTKDRPVWMGNVILTQASAYPTHLVLYWKCGEKKPWFLATNILTPYPAIRLYRRRMWIEEMFGDMKGHGFDLEASYLRHFLRLSRLTLLVCLLYLWLVAMAEHVISTHQVAEVDHSNRRDLSIFRLGWDFVERRLALFDPLPTVTIPNFCLVSGG